MTWLMAHSTKLAEKPGFLRHERFAYSSGDRITLSAKSEEVMSLSQFGTAGVGLVFNTAFSKPEWPMYKGNAHETNTLRHHPIPSEKAQDVWLQTATHLMRGYQGKRDSRAVCSILSSRKGCPQNYRKSSTWTRRGRSAWRREGLE